MDRGVVPTNQNPRLTRLRQPRSARGDRERRIGLSWVPMIGVQVRVRCPQANRKSDHPRRGSSRKPRIPALGLSELSHGVSVEAQIVPALGLSQSRT
jgi:hypothetical protein